MSALHAALQRAGYFWRTGEILYRPDDIYMLVERAGISPGWLPVLQHTPPARWWERCGQVIGQQVGDQALLRLVVELYLHAPGVDLLVYGLDEARRLVAAGELADPERALDRARARRGDALMGPLYLNTPNGIWRWLAPLPPDTPIEQVVHSLSSRSTEPGGPARLRLLRPSPAGGASPVPRATTLREAGVRSGDVLLVQDEHEQSDPEPRRLPPLAVDGTVLAPGVLILGRYRITERGRIDATRMSEVWQADDLDNGQRVALKVLRRGIEHRDEHVLGMLRVPGVVGLTGSFVLGDERVVVTTWVEGRPFPAGDPLLAWPRLLPLTRRVLETLRDVHALGVVHRDLKPGNVLVGANGEVTLIDFGVSMVDLSGLRDADSDRAPGTLAYIAPELRSNLSEASPASDLFALGVMLWKALTGQHPYPELERGAFSFALNEPRWPAEIQALPPAILRWLLSLLSANRQRRPANGAIALRDLLVAEHAEHGLLPQDEDELAACLPTPGPDGRLTPEDLATIFDADERIRRLRSRAAMQLLRRAGDQAGGIRAELLRWLRAGLIERSPLGLRIDLETVRRLEGVGLRDDALASIRDLPEHLSEPAATALFWTALAGADLHLPTLRRCSGLSPQAWDAGLAELLSRGLVVRTETGRLRDQTGGAGLYLGDLDRRRQAHALVGPLLDQANPRRLYHLTQAGLLSEAVGTAIFQAEALLGQDHLHDCVHLLGLAAQWSQSVQVTDTPALFRRLLLLALQTEDRHAQLSTLRFVRQSGQGSSQLITLVECATQALGGGAPHAAEALRALGELADPVLEGWRWSLTLLCEKRQGRPVAPESIEEMLDYARSSGDQAGEARAWMEHGDLLYRRNRPVAAEASFLHALSLRQHGFTRLPTLISLASALLDAGRDADAAMYADQALEAARNEDLRMYVVYAEWLLRRIGYQAGRPLTPDHELVWATATLEDPMWLGLVQLVEAAVAWRAGLPELGRSWARASAQLLEASRYPVGALLAWALAFHLGEPASSSERERLMERVEECQMPGVELQVLALIASDGSVVELARRRGRRALAELAMLPEGVDFGRRQEILSPAECAAILNLRLPPSQSPSAAP